MKIEKKDILYLIAFTILALMFLNKSNNYDENKKALEDKIIIIKDSLKIIDRQNKILENKKDSLSTVISVIKNNIETVIIEREVKVKEVDKMTISDKQKYFDENYGK